MESIREIRKFVIQIMCSVPKCPVVNSQAPGAMGKPEAMLSKYEGVI